MYILDNCCLYITVAKGLPPLYSLQITEASWGPVTLSRGIPHHEISRHHQSTQGQSHVE